jgi:hypothetical protein
MIGLLTNPFVRIGLGLGMTTVGSLLAGATHDEDRGNDWLAFPGMALALGGTGLSMSGALGFGRVAAGGVFAANLGAATLSFGNPLFGYGSSTLG